MKWIPFVCIILCACSTDTLEKRKEVAEELLSAQCDIITNSATDFIDSDLLSGLLDAVLGNRCDCVNEILVPKMAEKYTLEQLNEFREEPVNVKFAIKDLITENQTEVTNCFRLKNE